MGIKCSEISHKNRFHAHTFSNIAAGIGFVATIVLALHVLVIHSKLRVVPDAEHGQGQVVVSNRESTEHAFLVATIVVLVITFILDSWARLQSRNEDMQRWAMVEKHLGINLSHVPNKPVRKNEDVIVTRINNTKS